MAESQDREEGEGVGKGEGGLVHTLQLGGHLLTCRFEKHVSTFTVHSLEFKSEAEETSGSEFHICC